MIILKSLVLSVVFCVLALTHTAQNNKINWLSFEQAMQASKQNPKPLIIDMYTSWCGWCKKMDAETFTDTSVVSYINNKFYAVKFDAETTQEITYKDSVYKNNYVGQVDENGKAMRRKSHSLAEILLQGRMSYPTIVYMVPDKDFIAPVPGYMTPETIEPLLLYFGEGVYSMNLFEAFKKGMEVNRISK